MQVTEMVGSVTRGDQLVDGAGKVGQAATVLGLFGTISTANIQYYGLVVAGVATLSIQLWWEWYRQRVRAQQEAAWERKRAWINSEAYKARIEKQLRSEGIDTATLKALQQSPDPDSESQ